MNKKETLNEKLIICYNYTLSQPEKNDIKDNKNPIFKLLSKYDDILSILKIVNKDILKFLYFNRIKAHEILYDSDELISINKEEKELNYYFYLTLLIEENFNIVNYIYSIKLIKNLNEQQNKEKNRKIRRIILAKLILELIINYEQSDNEENANNKFDEDLNKMKNNNIRIIKDNIKAFEDFKLKEADIFSYKIDEIYVEIIKFLIIKKQLDDSDKTYNLIREIDLQSINLTKIMFDGLSSVLKKEYLKEYIIEKYDDIFEIKKINFYYMLLRYILKCNYYIYQIPFLLETRNKIRKIIKNNIEKFNISLKQQKDFKDKIEYVLKCFIEFNYYNTKSIKIIKERNENERRVVSNSSNIMDTINNKNMFCYGLNENIGNSLGSGFFSASSFKREKENSGRNFDGFVEESRSELDILRENNKNDIIFKILTKSIFKIEFNKKDNKTIAKLCGIKIEDKEENINFDTIKKYISGNDILNNNYKKFLNILDYAKNKIISEFANNFNFKITLAFKSSSVENNLFHIDCKYQLEIPDENPTEFQDRNILNNNELEELEGFRFLLNEINARRN